MGTTADVAFGARLARLRREAGKSQRRLAEILCELSGRPTVTRHEISRYERGERVPRFWLPYLAQALGVSLDLLERLAYAAPPERDASAGSPADTTVASPDGEGGLLTGLHSEQSRRRIGPETIAGLRTRIHALRLADDVIAGGDLLTPAVREFEAATRLHRESHYSPEVGRALLGAIGELAQIAGWIASDAGQHERAERIYRLGVSAAREAADRTLAANLIGCLAYQTTNVADPKTGLALAASALDEAADHAPPRARALFIDRLAWANARSGRTSEAIRLLGVAADALHRSHAEDDPPYLYWVDEAELRIMEARVHTELHRPLRAIPILTEVLGEYDATHARELALYLSWLAVALTDANEPEEAARTGMRMLDLSVGMPSDRVFRRSQTVATRLASFRNVPEVHDFLDRCSTATRLTPRTPGAGHGDFPLPD